MGSVFMKRITPLATHAQSLNCVRKALAEQFVLVARDALDGPASLRDLVELVARISAGQLS